MTPRHLSTRLSFVVESRGRRLVESHDDDPPDLPPELDAKLDELLRGRSKRDGSQDD